MQHATRCLGQSPSKVVAYEDNWKGVTDQAERRKRQNRINQRAQRLKRKLAQKSEAIAANEVPWTGHGMLVMTEDHIRRSSDATELLPRQPHVKNIPRSRKLIPPLLDDYDYDPVTCSHPPPSVILPLSLDHCLLVLIQYNVLRATYVNMKILSLPDFLDYDRDDSPPCSVFVASPGVIPPDLHPTAVQQCTPHESWIRSIPIPVLRDNLIVNAGRYDADDLCLDLCGGLYEGFEDVQRRGFMMWGDPWNAQSWEVSEGFVKKWGFLLKGCQDLIENSNRWREFRGEERLVVEVG